MERVTISQLKNRLSAYLDQVKQGRTILILDRDQPIARLDRAGAMAEPNDRIAQLERSGVLKRATHPIPFEMLSEKGPASTNSVLQALLDDREEGR